MDGEPGFLTALAGDGRSLLMASAGILIASGAFAIFQASTGQLLPHDAAYLAMSASALCALQDCRILHFMVHDRISFGGTVAIGVAYLWLGVSAQAGPAWAWWALAASGALASQLLGYLGTATDTWHGRHAGVVPCFAGARPSRDLRRSASVRRRSSCVPRRESAAPLLRPVGYRRRLTIVTVGMTAVFGAWDPCSWA